MKQREIKYKSLYRGEWYEVEEMFLENGNVTPTKFKGENFSPDSEHIKCTVQYTGLKDKNSKDIYEGDICKYLMDETPFSDEEDLFNYKEFKGTVEYNNRKGWYHFVGLDYTPTLSNYTISDIEVLGNIYEHPGLLV